MPVIHLTTEAFHQQIEVDQTTALVEFQAPWCSHCRRLGPALAALSEERPSLLVAEVDIDESPRLAEQFDIEVVPTLIFFRSGKPTGFLTGPDSKAAVSRFLEAQG